MFIHLKLKSLKGLQECRLENLGRLNVISGKNNSGKTTVLEAFNSSENRSSGFDASPTAVAAFIDEFRKLPGWEDIAPTTKFDPDLTQALEEALRHRRVWYDDEQQELVSELRNRLHASDLRGRSFDKASVEKLVKEIFPQGTTVLIPASRTLTLVRTLDVRESTSPFTLSFVNRLAHLKTQPLGSYLHVQFESLCRAFEFVSSGHKLDIRSEPKGNRVELVFSQPAGSRDVWRPAQDCGLGLQDLAVILYHAIVESADTVLLEEPESHMHPALQKRLVRFLLNETTKQYMISTHSSVFLDTTIADQVFLCEYRDQVTVRSSGDTIPNSASQPVESPLFYDKIRSWLVLLASSSPDCHITSLSAASAGWTSSSPTTIGQST